MANLTVTGTDLVLTLQPPERLMIRTWRRSAFKKMAAGKPQVRFPLSAVVLAEVAQKPLEVLGALGFRVNPFPTPIGTASPPLMSFAQLHKSQTFAAVYGTMKPAVIVGFADSFPWSYLVVTVMSPEKLVREIEAAAR
jgi:hypothetical protein